MKTARVLDLDPDLGNAITQADLPRARATLVAGSYELPAGRWEISEATKESGAYGLLVTSGVMALRTSIADRATLELVGPGDLLQPWVQLGAETSAPPTADWRVLERARVLLLDYAFGFAAAQWPQIGSALMHRLVLRSRRLCYQLAVNTAPQIEQRLLYSLWSLADRWGRVTEQGTWVELRLTHQQLAELVGAQRPSVPSALSHLREEQTIGYDRTGFILYGDIPGEVAALKGQLAL
jgi:CRP/FNR family transcriptional regulator, cyclic AMP receptor protein